MYMEPIQKKLIRDLEKVQKRATKKVPGFKNMPYSQRLKKLKLPTLVYRRLRGDMIDTFKILKGFYDSECSPKLPRAIYSGTRGHSLKLFKPSAKNKTRSNFYSIRVVDYWNSLPESVIGATTINCFKNRLDRHWMDQPILYDYEAEFIF